MSAVTKQSARLFQSRRLKSGRWKIFCPSAWGQVNAKWSLRLPKEGSISGHGNASFMANSTADGKAGAGENYRGVNYCPYNEKQLMDLPLYSSENDPTYSRDGVDLTLIRWMISLTPEQRLNVLQENISSIYRLRHAGNRTTDSSNSSDAE